MNKSFFIVLAICLVCTHGALVKRQIPNPIDQFGQIGQKIQEVANPAAVAKGLFGFANNAQKATHALSKRHTPEQLGELTKNLFEIPRKLFDSFLPKSSDSKSDSKSE